MKTNKDLLDLWLRLDKGINRDIVAAWQKRRGLTHDPVESLIKKTMGQARPRHPVADMIVVAVVLIELATAWCAIGGANMNIVAPLVGLSTITAGSVIFLSIGSILEGKKFQKLLAEENDFARDMAEVAAALIMSVEDLNLLPRGSRHVFGRKVLEPFAIELAKAELKTVAKQGSDEDVDAVLDECSKRKRYSEVYDKQRSCDAIDEDHGAYLAFIKKGVEASMVKDAAVS